MPRRRPQTASILTRERIVATALALLDEEGLERLTMRRLGAALGVDPMAVYHYLPNKEALYDAIVEAVWSEIVLPPMHGPWTAQLEALSRAVRTTLRAHPNALPIMATRPNVSAPGLAALEHGVTILRDAGFAPLQAVELLSAGFSFLIGHALADVGLPPADLARVTGQPVRELLRARAARERYPLVAASLDDAGRGGDGYMAAVFELGLTAFIRGIEALRDAQMNEGPPPG
jgi:TetR/AcrR family transcriptional regulator, tetracycline repressor protein